MNTHSSSLSPMQVLVRQTINKHTQITSSQLRRLLYVGTPEGQRVRSQRHLKRLYELGLIRRVWSVYEDRPAEYLYMPASSTTRGAVAHTLDITELYVRLVEKVGPSLIWDREPDCHIDVGRVTLYPDAFLDLGGDDKFFIEVDRDTERKGKLGEKMRRYTHAFYDEWDVTRDGELFPTVVWVTRSRDGFRRLSSVVKAQRRPAMFKVVMFDDFVEFVLKG